MYVIYTGGRAMKHGVLDARGRLVVFAVAWWSGFFVMGVELLGGRVLSPVFGSSLHVWGSLITVFMLALATGYLIGGQWSLQRPTLAKLGKLLLVSVVLTLPLSAAAEPILNVLGDIEDPRLGSLLAALILFTGPALCLGMVSPYCVRLLVPSLELAGQYAGRLYFVSTLGSAMGTLATSFFFVLWFEVATLLWAFCLLSLALAMVAWRTPERYE
jgi:hypothetical protein